MALSERAELVARLSLQDDFSRRVSAVSRNFSTSMSKIQKTAIQGAKTTAANLGRIGVVAGGFIALNVKQGISSLAELEDAVTSVDGAISQVGKGWTTTGQTIAAWANDIERNVQAAFDDKEITQAAETLIRYGKVSEDNLRPAMEVMTDLAARTGDVGTAGELLAKALADPEKAAGKLARQGIILTEQQQDQIKAMVEAGDTAKAQRFLLDQLAKSTKGAAAASAGPYRDALNILKDVTEDAQRALGEAFLPVLSRVADVLSKELAKPETIENLRSFGRTLAGAFDKVLEVGGRIPWGTIGDSLKLAGAGAKAVFDAFTMLPPWVQQAVITGWGLNKLTGGALGSIVGELGKGLIKGVLGINAGVVNVRGAVVNGGGVPVGGPGAAAGAAGAGLLGVATVAIAAGSIAALIAGIGLEIAKLTPDTPSEQALKKVLTSPTTNPATLAASGSFGKTGFRQVGPQKVVAAETLPVKPLGMSPDERQEAANQRQRQIDLARKSSATHTAVERAKAAIDWSRQATNQSKAAIVTAEQRGSAAIVAAIRANRTVVNIAFSSTTVRRVSGSTVDWRYRDRKYVPI